MKIGLDVSQMVYSGHGVARYCKELTRALLMRGDHEYILYAGALRHRGALILRSQNKPWSSATWRLPPVPPRLARLVFNYTNLPVDWIIGKVDVFHSSDWTEPYSKAISVTTVHDLAFYYFPDTVSPLVKKTQATRLKRVVARGTHIIADSRSTKNDLMKTYQLKSNLIDIVYPGIDSRFSPQSKTEIDRVKKKYNLPPQYLLTLGTKEPRKNLPRLIEAASRQKLPLVIAGRFGWGAKLSSSKQVIETGYVEDTDLPALYSGASVFAYPSLYEGFGFPAVEAMACGVPVVTSNVSSLPEIVGEAGVLVNPSSIDSIFAGLTRGVKESTRLSKLGLSQAKHFTWERTASETVQVYERLYEYRH